MQRPEIPPTGDLPRLRTIYNENFMTLYPVHDMRGI